MRVNPKRSLNGTVASESVLTRDTLRVLRVGTIHIMLQISATLSSRLEFLAGRGRPRKDSRAVLDGILWVLSTGGATIARQRPASLTVGGLSCGSRLLSEHGRPLFEVSQRLLNPLFKGDLRGKPQQTRQRGIASTGKDALLVRNGSDAELQPLALRKLGVMIENCIRETAYLRVCNPQAWSVCGTALPGCRHLVVDPSVGLFQPHPQRKVWLPSQQ